MAKKRIHAIGEYTRQMELVAAGAISPGMLCILGSAGTITVHADEGGRAETMIAAEDALQGNTVSTAYSSGDQVTLLLPKKGEEFNGLVEDGQNVAIGDFLISAGNGKFKVASDLESGETYDQAIAVAVEANDLTGSNSSDTLSTMRAL